MAPPVRQHRRCAPSQKHAATPKRPSTIIHSLTRPGMPYPYCLALPLLSCSPFSSIAFYTQPCTLTPHSVSSKSESELTYNILLRLDSNIGATTPRSTHKSPTDFWLTSLNVFGSRRPQTAQNTAQRACACPSRPFLPLSERVQV